MDSKKLALGLAQAAKSKKAQRVIVLDMRTTSGFCDYFVISSATSLRQVNAVGKAIYEKAEELGIKPLSKVPSEDASGWVVVDCGSAVAHVFYKPMREFYSLERLWSDAKRVRITASRKK